MESLKEFYDEIKSRLTSPLFGSFVIAWLIYNWYIPIALIFYSSKDLKADHLNSFKEVIIRETNLLNNLIWPMLTACLYTFIYPWIRAYIKQHQTKVYVKSQDKILEITNNSKTYKTEIGKKDALLEVAREENKSLESRANGLAQDLGNQRSEIERLQSEVSRLQSDVNTQLKLQEDNENLNDLKIFAGNWRVEFSIQKQQFSQHWKIDLNGVVKIDNEKVYTLNAIIGYGGTVWLQVTFHNSLNGKPDAITVFQLVKRESGSIGWAGQDIQQNSVFFHRYESVLVPIGDSI